jgi:hypothetical protein
MSIASTVEFEETPPIGCESIGLPTFRSGVYLVMSEKSMAQELIQIIHEC